jgi:hypothetical protein
MTSPSVGLSVCHQKTPEEKHTASIRTDGETDTINMLGSFSYQTTINNKTNNPTWIQKGRKIQKGKKEGKIILYDTNNTVFLCFLWRKTLLYTSITISTLTCCNCKCCHERCGPWPRKIGSNSHPHGDTLSIISCTSSTRYSSVGLFGFFLHRLR